ncbi:MAG: hypothetical protein O3B88_00900 [Bacteroidetes bacterium]|nr:hypothetical protein [Bacteroidota bacterium]MDA0863208.1 hypothetical protein [Bacteroidota bacterium]
MKITAAIKSLYPLVTLSLIIFWSSCQTEFDSVPSTGALRFSNDTIFLDTIFENIGSSTYTLKVYNDSDKNVTIPQVALAQGTASNYRLNVDGQPGQSFEDVQILARDSIFVFIETTVGNLGENAQMVYEDKLVFDSGNNAQNVTLVTLVQQAHFLFPEPLGDGIYETLDLGEDVFIDGFFLDDNELTWTADKPWVIYGYAAIPAGKTLNIEPGARVHFHENSGIIAANGAALKAIGLPSNDPEALEGQIIFESDRLEPGFSDIPGQWGTIWLTAGSTNHEFSYVTVKNNLVGILMDSNDGDRTLTLKNVQIYNTATSGLLAQTGDVYGENVVISNSGQAALALTLGGRYKFIHSTFSNYWSNSFRSFPSVQVTNALAINDQEILVADLEQAEFVNCIIYGTEQREIGLYKEDLGAFNVLFDHCLIKFQDPLNTYADEPLYDFANPTLYRNLVLNEDPVFENINLNDFDISLEESAAVGRGSSAGAVAVPVDLNGSLRPASNADLGAYQAISFPEN